VLLDHGEQIAQELSLLGREVLGDLVDGRRGSLAFERADARVPATVRWGVAAAVAAVGPLGPVAL
jgi:hypothetical protein